MALIEHQRISFISTSRCLFHSTGCRMANTSEQPAFFHDVIEVFRLRLQDINLQKHAILHRCGLIANLGLTKACRAVRKLHIPYPHERFSFQQSAIAHRAPRRRCGGDSRCIDRIGPTQPRAAPRVLEKHAGKLFSPLRFGYAAQAAKPCPRSQSQCFTRPFNASSGGRKRSRLHFRTRLGGSRQRASSMDSIWCAWSRLRGLLKGPGLLDPPNTTLGCYRS